MKKREIEELIDVCPGELRRIGGANVKKPASASCTMYFVVSVKDGIVCVLLDGKLKRHTLRWMHPDRLVSRGA